MTEVMINPFIRVALDSYIKGSFHMRERVIFDYELLLIKEGNVKIEIEGESFFAHNGDLILFKPGQRHAMRSVEGDLVRQPHIHFDLEYFENRTKIPVSFKNYDEMTTEEKSLIRRDITEKGSPYELPNKINITSINYVEKLLFNIIGYFQSPVINHKLEMIGDFYKLFSYLIVETTITNKAAHTTKIGEYVQIRNYISQHHERTVTLDELSQKFHVNKFNLQKMFKKTFGVTPAEYSRSIRIQKAKELLLYNHRNITEVAMELEFSSIQAFSRMFFQVEGKTPYDFLKHNRTIIYE